MTRYQPAHWVGDKPLLDTPWPCEFDSTGIIKTESELFELVYTQANSVALDMLECVNIVDSTIDRMRR